MPKFRIAICGAGISGLALAVTLGKYSDIPVDLYELTPEITTVEAGINVWKRTWRIMQHLGLDVELGKKAESSPVESPKLALTCRRGDQPAEGYNFYELITPYGMIGVHRADLLDMLKNGLSDKCSIHFSKRVTTYSRDENGGIVIHFQDGSAATADVLIGADGIRSAVRPTFLEELSVKVPELKDPAFFHSQSDPIWTGSVTYRCLVSSAKLHEVFPNHRAITSPLMYLGKNKHFISYPLSQVRLVNVLAFNSEPHREGTPFTGKWVYDAPPNELLDLFSDWEPEIQALVKVMENPSCWAIHAMNPLKYYASDRVAIMGDAAHAMTTHYGAAAGQAIEDAYILGRLLSDPSVSLERVPQALKVYEDIRRDFANKVVQDSRMTGLIYEFNGPVYDGIDRTNEEEKLKAVGEAIFRQWEWQWKFDIDNDWARAQEGLKVAISTAS